MPNIGNVYTIWEIMAHEHEWAEFSSYPRQVKFADDRNDVNGGILYNNQIICGCCGGVMELNDEDISWVRPLEWINISEEIIGV